jgi:hypothetical protein
MKVTCEPKAAGCAGAAQQRQTLVRVPEKADCRSDAGVWESARPRTLKEQRA